ncbi:hypothetical protein CC78DRAFT_542148 [Lojkania enalia]|uniref:Uncharacterized protein n=1 Tax=Lojkania enalia TaxID=147567 RepID=A0A9P4KDV9_9PLEO|nr:hypothetical protein CC78DRAFT_542148 [Didymosphaeria enalia]
MDRWAGLPASEQRGSYPLRARRAGSTLAERGIEKPPCKQSSGATRDVEAGAERARGRDLRSILPRLRRKCTTRCAAASSSSWGKKENRRPRALAVSGVAKPSPLSGLAQSPRFPQPSLAPSQRRVRPPGLGGVRTSMGCVQRLEQRRLYCLHRGAAYPIQCMQQGSSTRITHQRSFSSAAVCGQLLRDGATGPGPIRTANLFKADIAVPGGWRSQWLGLASERAACSSDASARLVYQLRRLPRLYTFSIPTRTLFVWTSRSFLPPSALAIARRAALRNGLNQPLECLMTRRVGRTGAWAVPHERWPGRLSTFRLWSVWVSIHQRPLKSGL